MPQETIPLLGPTQESRSVKVNGQRSINMFASIEKPGAKTPIAMYSTPGLLLTHIPTSGTCRSNGVKWNSHLYKIIGDQLVKIDATGIGTAVGTLNSSSGRCVIARGRSYIGIVDGTDGYSYDGTTFAEITDFDFPSNPTHIAWLDDYFIVNVGSSDSYAISDTDDPTSWAAVDRGRAQGAPDDILALTTTQKDLYLIGDETTEVHYNSGNATFPFEAYQGGIIPVGIEARHSLVKTPYGLIWLATSDGGDAAVIRANGFQIEPISDEDLNYQINELDTTSDAFGMTWRQHGRTFYAITFPSDDRTWVYDMTSQLWHERKSDGVGRWRVSGIGRIGSYFICGDYNSGNLYRMSGATYTENGSQIERKRITQVVHKNNKTMTFNRLIIDVESGVGLTSGQGSNPQLMMRYSDDGQKTWSNEQSRSIGAIGEYRKRITFDNLGEGSRERAFEFRFTDPASFTICGAYADIEWEND